MAHLLDMSLGRAGMAYRGELPWHGLGVNMRGDETLDQWRIRAGLGWEAKKTPVLFNDSEGIQTVTGKSVLYRDDTRGPLGVVGDDYKIVQPHDVMEFYRDLTERWGFKMETAGGIKGGRVIWALAKVGEEVRVAGNDVLKGYLLLSTSFDGSAATTGRFTTIRVVCNNTLSAATNSKPDVSVSHRSMFDPDAVKLRLGVGDAFGKFSEDASKLAERPVSPEESVEFFLKVYHGMTAAEISTDKDKKATEKTIKRLADHFLNGPGAELRSARNTAWGLLNAVTFDIDHVRKSRTPEGRFEQAMFGTGETLKNKAREIALAMAA